MAKLKILLFNMGYGLGLDGSKKDYALKWYRYLHCPNSVKENVLKGIKQLIKSKNPDLCCLIEIEGAHADYFNKDQPYYDITNKYGSKSVLSRLPAFRTKSNAVFSKKKLPIKRHYFKNGTKKLIYEVSLPKGITLLMTHFSLAKNTRKKQFAEIMKLIKDKTILCGDFNIFAGLQEIEPLLKKANLKIINKTGTFPAHNPKKALDLFLCTKNIKVKSCKTINKKLSDHLPVLLEINI
ncbi:endonuclease/exonuclease/phosphatase family protein [Candidatus Woesearchaeota archaeon]|nr:endonuclease/exonuclease/phosphatase family protein [Candidatus Woesearchaeota archaeon]MBW3006427.1 endonuclease/exonuclease/phosphatase family protein [Candidatus Woesearchaeota archaeon]